MTLITRTALLAIALTLAPSSLADGVVDAPQLPAWQVIEFEQRAFWATARSRLEILPDAEDPGLWEMDALSSVVNNSEQVHALFDPVSGRVVTGTRISQGRGQRLKSFEYTGEFILRERRDPETRDQSPPEDWPLTSSQRLANPASGTDLVVSSPYLLVPLAAQLQAQGPDRSIELIVHTDLNFYRVRLNSGAGIPIDVDYEVEGQGRVRGKRETTAVALLVSPEGTLAEDNDFSLLGLEGEIILFFDRDSGLPLQVRGLAPRVGTTEINLKSVTPRQSPQ